MLSAKYKNKFIDLDKKFSSKTNWLSKISQKIETIKAAAISINGRIFTGRSHAEAAMKAFKITSGIDLIIFSKSIPESSWNLFYQWMRTPEVADRSEGFVTNKGRFVSREEAFEIAERAEQLKYKSEDPALISEHVSI